MSLNEAKTGFAEKGKEKDSLFFVVCFRHCGALLCLFKKSVVLWKLVCEETCVERISVKRLSFLLLCVASCISSLCEVYLIE